MYSIISHPKLTGQMALAASIVIESGFVLLDVSKLSRIPRNNRHALTIAEGQYLDTVGTDVMYLDHSCQPNLIFELETLKFITKRQIAVGEILSFDYTLTELEISSPFDCVCGYENCQGRVGSNTGF